MDVDETIAHVKRLLELLSGIEVVWVQRPPSFVRFGLAVQSQASLAQLAHIAVAANVLLVVEVDWEWQAAEDDPECLRYDLRVSSDYELDEPPTNLQVVGIYLVRCHKKSGRLAPNEADELLRAWNSVVE